MVFSRKQRMAAPPGSTILRRMDPGTLIACILLVAVLWQFGAPLLANTPCGLIVPHEHILLGQADARDLERHLTAEANCALGKPDAPDQQAPELRGSKGKILNVIRSDRSEITHLLTLDQSNADLPRTAAVEHIPPLFTLLVRLDLPDQSVTFPPPEPPPETV